MATKSVKISTEHHHLLKVQAAELSIPLQEYLELMLDLVLSQAPVMRHLREEYLQTALASEE